jgi:hypothetical protein
MNTLAHNRTTGGRIIAVLVLIQTVFGVLPAFEWFQVGSDVMGKGILILPLIGMVAYARGALVAGIALLYVIFALGVLMRRGWARSFGIAAAVVNLLLVLSVVVQGESLLQALLWSILPGIVLWYLLTPAGVQLKGKR